MTHGVDEHAAQELAMYVDNDEPLYRQRFMPMVKNLINKMANRTYDRAKAITMFMYLVDDGAKKYAKEFSVGTDWNTMFDRPTRLAVAKYLRDTFETEAKLGNYDQYITKAAKARMVKASNRNTTGRRTPKRPAKKRARRRSNKCCGF